MIAAGVIAGNPFADLPLANFTFGGASLSSQVSESSTFRLFAGTAEMATQPDDDPANEPVWGTLQQALRFERSLLSGEAFGALTVGWGEMVLINTDGAYDAFLAGYAVDGRDLTLKLGRAGSAYRRFETVFRGTMAGWDIQEDTVVVSVRDRGNLLEVPAQDAIYAGTGGIEGGDELKGKRRPAALGELVNVSPPLLDPALLIYDLNDGPIDAVLAVRDRGAALTATVDHSSYNSLTLATVAPGAYATCLTAGKIRLGAQPAGTVTVDLSGDKADGVYVSSTARIVERLLLARTRLVADDLDAYAFAALDALQPAPVGYWLGADDGQSVADVVGRLVAGIGGFSGFGRDGRFGVGRFDLPDGVPSGRYGREDLLAIDRLRPPGALNPPPWRYRTAYARNWTVQTDLAGLVPAATVARLAAPWSVAQWDDRTILARHPLAQDAAVIESFFHHESDAFAEAERRLDLFGRPSSLYRFTAHGRPFQHEVGGVVHVTYPRWDLGAGRLLRIVAVSEDCDANTVEITGFA
ncbi:hypothetical protein ASE61_15105 [Bosea sp. Root670]|uniref:hypothetical protein n=1 Tax=Bosea sp. Root670 TaxID=1736583 RepID=UPI000713609F|nr:hypothetical protein [Bosea sp. Root670]KRE02603.1 hypothetical protein ASE61_15105 [Bosea sp. Root670]